MHRNNKADLGIVYMDRKGFTLIELMATVALIVLLAGLALSTMVHHFAKAKRQKAIAQIQRLESALEGFKSDMGCYPAVLTDGNEYFGSTVMDKTKRSSLIEALSGFDKNKNKIATYWDDANWHGPYLEFKKSELDSYGEMIDPWRAPYLFDGSSSGRDLMNKSGIDIISTGPDREWDSSNENSSKNDDNVCNWLADFVKESD